MISQKDIAKALNISRVTVTKALKDHADISVETKEKVKKKALELGYIPDFIGRSLSSRQTFIIGIVLPKIAHSFFAHAVEMFYTYANEKGYNIIPMISFEDSKQEKKNIETLLSMRVDGIILDIAGNSLENYDYDLIKRTGTKFIFFDRSPLKEDELVVAGNDRESAYLLTKRLIEKGYRKIYHFAGPSGLSISAERQKGYEEAMSKAGLLKYIFHAGLMPDEGYNALNNLASQNELPEAIVSINDSVAHGIYKAANELGIVIPDDLAIAGFGDLESSKLLKPPLTSVKIPIDKMAKYAIDSIIKMIEKGEELTGKKIFKAEIIEREST